MNDSVISEDTTKARPKRETAFFIFLLGLSGEWLLLTKQF